MAFTALKRSNVATTSKKRDGRQMMRQGTRGGKKPPSKAAAYDVMKAALNEIKSEAQEENGYLARKVMQIALKAIDE